MLDIVGFSSAHKKSVAVDERANLAVARPPSTAPKSWRSVLPIHPAAELFPFMSADELHALGEDIKKNGLTSPVVLWRPHPQAPAQLLDGRNRLDAIEIATGSPAEVGAPSITAGDFLACDKVIVLDKSVDPWAYVVSANVHRRHLTIEDKDRVIVQLLKADPTKSNRRVAKLTDTSHPHVAKVREHAEKAGDVETVTTSVDTKGRKQPALKRLRSKQPATGQTRARGISNRNAPKLTRHDVHTWFSAAPVAEHQHLFDGLGSRVVAAAIPPTWNMRLVPAEQGIGQIAARENCCSLQEAHHA